MGKFSSILGYSAIVVFIGGLLTMFALSLPGSGWRALSVQTGSMKPDIDPGALVLVHRVPSDRLAVGDVITYTSSRSAAETITHRIIGIEPIGNGKNYYILKGDANPTRDAPVQESQIVGKVVEHAPYAGHAIDFVDSPLGLLVAVYIPASIIAVSEIRLLTRRLLELEDVHETGTRLVHRDISPIYGTRPARPQTTSAYRLYMAFFAAGAVAVSVSGYKTLAQLSTPPAVLSSTSISSGTLTPPGIPVAETHTSNVSHSRHSTTTSNNTAVTITNNNPQSAASGNALSSNGAASTGNATNSHTSAAKIATPPPQTNPLQAVAAQETPPGLGDLRTSIPNEETVTDQP